MAFVLPRDMDTASRTHVLSITQDNIRATTGNGMIDLQALLWVLSDKIDRAWWLDIARDAWDAAAGKRG